MHKTTYMLWIALVWVAAAQGAITMTGTATTVNNAPVVYDGVSDPWEAVPSTRDLTFKGATLTITGGSRVNVSDDLFVGSDNASDVITITGTGSLFTAHEGIFGGDRNGPEESTLLTVTNGGMLSIINAGTTSHLRTANFMKVWGPGTLTGDGTVRVGRSDKPGRLDFGGTLAPGADGLGTLTVDLPGSGDMTLLTGAILRMEVDNSGRADKLVVTGDLIIQDGVSLQPAPTELISATRTYSVVEATTLTGTLDCSGSPMLDITLSEAAGPAIQMQVAPKAFDNPEVTVTANQRAVGGILQGIVDSGGNDVVLAIQGMGTLAEVQETYDALSGQDHMDTAGASLGVQIAQAGAVADRLRSLRGTPTAAGSPTVWALGRGTPEGEAEDWGLWGRGFSLSGDRKAETGTSGYQSRFYGGAGGADLRISQGWSAGLFAGFSSGEIEHSKTNVAQVSGLHFGAYGTWDAGRWSADVLLDYADFSYATRRGVTVDTISDTLRGDFGGGSLGASLDLGYRVHEDRRWALQPSAGLRVTRMAVDGYAESGDPNLALRIGDQSYNSFRASAGVEAEWYLYKGSVSPQGALQVRARYEHEFGDTACATDARFVGLPTETFRLAGAELARNSFVVGGGMHGRAGKNTWLRVDADVRLSADEQALVVYGTVEHRFK